MTEEQYQSKIQELRIKWKKNPDLRDIIELQARALTNAWVKRTATLTTLATHTPKTKADVAVDADDSGEEDIIEIAKEIFSLT